MRANPIPPDEARWDVYAKLARREPAVPLGRCSRIGAHRKARTREQQQIGDFFAACMDEAAVEKRAASPSRRTSRRSPACASKRELAALLGKLHARGRCGLLFTVASEPDAKDATPSSPAFDAAASGSPTATTTSNPDDGAREIRARYLAHVAQDARARRRLAARRPRAARDGAAHRDRAREGVAHARREARPVQASTTASRSRSSRRSRPRFAGPATSPPAARRGSTRSTSPSRTSSPAVEHAACRRSRSTPGRPTCAGTARDERAPLPLAAVRQTSTSRFHRARSCAA